jgi:thymidylate synthase
MKNYLELLSKIMDRGVDRQGRNGMTRMLFAEQLRWDMSSGEFPLVTTKRMAFRSIVGELLWFLSGSTDEVDLRKIMGKDETIWTKNVDDFLSRKEATAADRAARWAGLIYGHQWRRWNGSVDQISNLISLLKSDPDSRRLVVTAWNPSDLPFQCLPSCHMGFQLFHYNGELSLHMVQRSCDMFLGVPFNIASYGLLLRMICHVVGMSAGELVITFNDAHIYHSHFEAVATQLKREPYLPPKITIDPEVTDIDDFRITSFRLVDYNCWDAIKAEMLV